jgi:hypothetical protein
VAPTPSARARVGVTIVVLTIVDVLVTKPLPLVVFIIVTFTLAVVVTTAPTGVNAVATAMRRVVHAIHVNVVAAVAVVTTMTPVTTTARATAVPRRLLGLLLTPRPHAVPHDVCDNRRLRQRLRSGHERSGAALYRCHTLQRSIQRLRGLVITAGVGPTSLSRERPVGDSTSVRLLRALQSPRHTRWRR